MTNINVPQSSDEMVGKIYHETAEEQEMIKHIFDVEPELSIQEARTARQARDRERKGIPERPYRFGDDAREDMINSYKNNPL